MKNLYSLFSGLTFVFLLSFNSLFAQTVSSVSSFALDGTKKIGDQIEIKVTFSESVVITGTPQLVLETGSLDSSVNYSGSSSGTIMNFLYTVSAGDLSEDLDYVSTSSLVLNSGSIKNLSGNNANLTLPSPGQDGSLSHSQAYVIDGVAPTLTSVAAADATYKVCLLYTSPSPRD